MRSEARPGRAGASSAERRSSSTLKLRPAKQAPSTCGPRDSSDGAAQPALQSALYAAQLWRASGHVQHALSCDRDLFFPELAVPLPVFKQLPADAEPDCKRAKLGASRQQLAAARLRDAAAVADASLGCLLWGAAALEERASSGAHATSSSSSHPAPRRRSLGAQADSQGADAWLLLAPSRQPRSSRRRRTAWAEGLPLILQVARAPDAAAAAAPAPPAAVQPARPQLERQPQQAQQAQRAQPPAASAPAAAVVCPGSRVVVLAGKPAPPAAAAAPAAEAAPPETSTSSDMTCCGDSPRAPAGRQRHGSWPTTSSDSEHGPQQQQQQQQSLSLSPAGASKLAPLSHKRQAAVLGSPLSPNDGSVGSPASPMQLA